MCVWIFLALVRFVNITQKLLLLLLLLFHIDYYSYYSYWRLFLICVIAPSKCTEYWHISAKRIFNYFLLVWLYILTVLSTELNNLLELLMKFPLAATTIRPTKKKTKMRNTDGPRSLMFRQYFLHSYGKIESTSHEYTTWATQRHKKWYYKRNLLENEKDFFFVNFKCTSFAMNTTFFCTSRLAISTHQFSFAYFFLLLIFAMYNALGVCGTYLLSLWTPKRQKKRTKEKYS